MTKLVGLLVLFAVVAMLGIAEGKLANGKSEECVKHNGQCHRSSDCCGDCCKHGICMADDIRCRESRSVRDPCSGTCGVGEECHLDIYCVQKPCPQIGRCIPVCRRKCPAGQECYLQTVNCIRAPCPPIQSCRNKQG